MTLTTDEAKKVLIALKKAGYQSFGRTPTQSLVVFVENPRKQTQYDIDLIPFEIDMQRDNYITLMDSGEKIKQPDGIVVGQPDYSPD
jgi:hypothetical protein